MPYFRIIFLNILTFKQARRFDTILLFSEQDDEDSGQGTVERVTLEIRLKKKQS